MEKQENRAEEFNLREMASFFSRNGCVAFLRCAEWSDGRTEGVNRTPSAVQKSRTTGKYMWLDDYIAEGESMGVVDTPKSYCFHDLQEAYCQFECTGELEDERCVQLLWDIVRAFNDRYRRRHSSAQTRKMSPSDSRFYINCILELLKKGGDAISGMDKIELYREAGMFSKCFEVFNSRFRWADREIIDELLFRAAHGDSSPFVLQPDV